MNSLSEADVFKIVRWRHYPKFFMREQVVCFLKVDKTCVDVFWILPRFLDNLLESENFVCRATAGTKSHWVHSSFCSIISRQLFSLHLVYTWLLRFSAFLITMLAPTIRKNFAGKTCCVIMLANNFSCLNF